MKVGWCDPLVSNSLLDAAAQKHADNMARQGFLSQALDGRSLMDRATAEGYDVSKENPYREKLLDMIQGLYDVNAREQGMDVEARTKHRQKYALPILEAVKQYVNSLTEAEVFPKSDMAGALGYIRNHWDALKVLCN